MNFSELVLARKSAEGVTWEQMAARAQAAGFHNFGKSQLSRAVHSPIREFPGQNMEAFRVALGVTMLELMCACANSIYGDRFLFLPGSDRTSMIVEQLQPSFLDGKMTTGPVTWELIRRDVAEPIDA